MIVLNMMTLSKIKTFYIEQFQNWNMYVLENSLRITSSHLQHSAVKIFKVQFL